MNIMHTDIRTEVTPTNMAALVATCCTIIGSRHYRH